MFKKYLTYLIFPILLFFTILSILYCNLLDIEKSINLTSTIVQTGAILIGGLWAYNKFGWEKRAESAIKLKAMLMYYEGEFNKNASIFRVEESNKKDISECRKDYAINMIPGHNKFNSEIHLSCYIPKKTRQKLFEVLWLALNKGRGPKEEDINKNWESFGEELKKVKEELDDLVSKI